MINEEHRTNFMAGLTKLKLIHDIDMNENEYLELAFIAWDKIGDKALRIYKLEVDQFDGESIELPCNYYAIEAVVTNVAYCCYDKHNGSGGYYSGPVQYYNNHLYKYYCKPFNSDLYNINGSFVNYSLRDGAIHFNDQDSYILKDHRIDVYYQGIIVDDSGLPIITERQSEAIAYYCAWIHYQKLLYQGRSNGDLVQYLKGEWFRICSQARVDEYLSQNAMDKILDASSSWDRKLWNKSYII